MEFDKNKFKNLLHYIVHKCGSEGNVEKTVLENLIYFSDFNFFELYEKSLTNETYQKSPQGPEPLHFDLAVSELKKEEKITSDDTMHNYTSFLEPVLDFDEKELCVIDEVIDELGHMTANQIAEYSKGDMPFKATGDRHIMDYGFVFYRDFPYEKRSYTESL